LAYGHPASMGNFVGNTVGSATIAEMTLGPMHSGEETMQPRHTCADREHALQMSEEMAASTVIDTAKNSKPISGLVASEEAMKLPRIGFARGMGDEQSFDYQAFQIADADVEALFRGGNTHDYC